MAENLVDAVNEHMARLASMQPATDPAKDLETLWETLSPSLQKALADQETRLVDWVKTMKGKT